MTKASPVSMTKNGILPYYLILFELFSISVFEFKSGLMRSHYSDQKEELKEKLYREYSGRNIEKIMRDI